MTEWVFHNGRLMRAKVVSVITRAAQGDHDLAKVAPPIPVKAVKIEDIRTVMGCTGEKRKATEKPEKWWKIARFCIACNGAGKKSRRRCPACNGKGRLAPLPKTSEPEAARVIPVVSDDQRAVMKETVWPVGELYERILTAKDDPMVRASVRAASVRKFTKDDDTTYCVQAQYRDQTMAFLGVYTDLGDFWLATQERINYVVRLIRRLRPFGLTTRIEAKVSIPREPKELTPEEIAKQAERKAAKGRLDAINMALGGKR